MASRAIRTLTSLLLLSTLATSLPTPNPHSKDGLVDAESVTTAKTLYITSNDEFIHISDADPLSGDRPAVDRVIEILKAYQYPETSSQDLVYVEPARVDLKRRQIEKDEEEEEEWFGRPVFNVESAERVSKRQTEDEEEVVEEWFGRPVFGVDEVERLEKRSLKGDMVDKLAWELRAGPKKEKRTQKGDMVDKLAWELRGGAKEKRALEVNHEGEEDDEFFVLGEKRVRALELNHEGEGEDDFFALDERR